MQSKGAIKLLAILLVIACIFQLSFTWKTRSVEKKAAEYAKHGQTVAIRDSLEKHYLDSVANLPVYNILVRKYTYKECKEKEINLGLDLRGGMNVMLEIGIDDVVEAMAKDHAHEPAFAEAMAAARKAVKNGDGNFIDEFAKAYDKASGGARLAPLFVGHSNISINSSDKDVVKKLQEVADDAVDNAYQVISKRIDQFGVAQPNIQRIEGSDRILVELPGVKEPERVAKLLQGTATLEFWPTYNVSEMLPYLQRADAVLSSYLAGSDSTAVVTNPLLSLLDMSRAGGAVVGAVDPLNVELVTKYLSYDAVKEVFPEYVSFKWGVKEDKDLGMKRPLYAIKLNADGKARVNGEHVSDARAAYAQTGAAAEVSLVMNSAGVAEWADLTEANVGKCVAIVLDDLVYSAPVVRQRIDGGNSSISGNFTMEEAQDLATVLRSGKMIAPARIIQNEVVGPSLGRESINAGLISFLIAFLLVLLYMGVFYRAAGWFADIALMVNVLLLFGVLVSFGAVLTLPGIAGIVLTMGMAVDANVIIFERIKEELRGGKGIAQAIKDGFSNAYSAIIDGQLTTIITGIVLYLFGTGPVKGFATTLIIGILTSLFCSILITRILIDWYAKKRGTISFSRKFSENFLANVKFDFVGKRKISYILAGALILVSVASLTIRGLNVGVDFTGGRVYVVRFDKSVSDEEVRKAVNDKFAAVEGADESSVSCEVKQFGGDDQIRIFTQYKHDETSSEEVTNEIIDLIYTAVSPFYENPISLEQFKDTQNDMRGIVSSTTIGNSIAREMLVRAFMAAFFALIAIGLYIAIRFRKWQWALGATVSLAQNVLIVIGIFSILYSFMPFSMEIDQAFIAAILTIIGYSINDTVVIFDRIREFLTLYPKRDFKENINNAISSTLSRTINTSATTLITLLAIFSFGGETIRGFIFALLLGVVIGTYSSIFIATPIAYDCMKKKMAKK